MTVAAVGDELFRLCNGVVKVLRLVHCEHGAQLFVSEFLADVHRLNLADEDLGALGNRNSRKSGDRNGLLSYDLCVERAVDDDSLSHLFALVVAEEVAAARSKLLLDLVIELFVNDHALFGGADHTVVKGLGVNDRVDRQKDVSALVDDRGSVAGAYAQSGFAAGVSSLYHSGTACSENAVGLLHKHICQLKRGNVDPADDSLGSARGNSRLQNELRRGDGALFCAGMRADDDSVSGFQTDKRLENRGGCGVGRRDYGGDHADRLGDFLCAVNGVLLNNAAGLDISVGIIDVFGGKVILYHLVLDNAHSRLLNSHFCQRQTRAVGCGGGGKKNPVDLLLREQGKFSLSGSYSFES